MCRIGCRIEPRIGSVRVMSRFSVDSCLRIESESKCESTVNRARIVHSDFPYYENKSYYFSQSKRLRDTTHRLRTAVHRLRASDLEPYSACSISSQCPNTPLQVEINPITATIGLNLNAVRGFLSTSAIISDIG